MFLSPEAPITSTFKVLVAIFQTTVLLNRSVSICTNDDKSVRVVIQHKELIRRPYTLSAISASLTFVFRIEHSKAQQNQLNDETTHKMPQPKSELHSRFDPSSTLTALAQPASNRISRNQPIEMHNDEDLQNWSVPQLISKHTTERRRAWLHKHIVATILLTRQSTHSAISEAVSMFTSVIYQSNLF